MSDDWVTKEDWAVLAQYGKTMLRVQQFELALKQSAHLIEPELAEEAPFEKAWRQVEKLLRTAAGPLTARLEELGGTPKELRDELWLVIRERNTLAHEFLLTYMFERNASLADYQEKIATLKEAEEHFEHLNAKISQISEGILRERGIDPDDPILTEDDLRRILAEDEAAEAQ